MLSNIGLFRQFFLKNKTQEYSSLDRWIAEALDIPISNLSVNRYYIKDGVWFCHEHFYLERRTVYDNISMANEALNTKRVRPATEEEIAQFNRLIAENSQV